MNVTLELLPDYTANKALEADRHHHTWVHPWVEVEVAEEEGQGAIQPLCQVLRLSRFSFQMPLSVLVCPFLMQRGETDGQSLVKPEPRLMRFDKPPNVKSESLILEHLLRLAHHPTLKRGWSRLLDYRITSIPPFRCYTRGWSRRNKSRWHR